MKTLFQSLLILAGCASCLANAGTHGADGAGADYFILQTTLPKAAKFTTVEANYISSSPQKCEKPKWKQDILNGAIQGIKTVILISEESTVRDQIDRRIPLSWHDGECDMWLYKVELIAAATYGPRSWQEATTAVMVDVLARHPDSAPRFDEQRTLVVNSRCSWFFRLDGDFGIGKLFICSALDGSGSPREAPHEWKSVAATRIPVGINELPGKTIKLSFQMSDQEHPTYEDPWIETNRGWQLCETEAGTPFCKAPMTFRSFMMNGRECAAYPRCTE